jgi:hypothetical protein
MYKYFILLIAAGICSAGVLMTNGDFEQELSVGWNQMIGSALSTDTIDRSTAYNPDPDYEVKVKKYDATHAKLYQTINIPTTDLQFSITANLYAYEYNTSATYWSAAAVCLRYLDNNDALLGETRIAHKSPHCPWTSSNTVHIITELFPNSWVNYSFNINDELVNLPGVTLSNIKKIQVALLDTTNGC